LIHGRGAVPAREQLGALVQQVRPALDARSEYDSVVDDLDRIAALGNWGDTATGAWRSRGEVMHFIQEAAVATLS
jgi:glutamate---cysteine ligase / carboxylate-amine ligase